MSNLHLSNMNQAYGHPQISGFDASVLKIQIPELGKIMIETSDSNLLKYDSSQTFVRYRRVLVDWICEATERMRLVNATAHLAVAILDRVLSLESFEKDRLQLVATCCIMIAGKIADLDSHTRPLTYLVKSCSNQYTIQDFKSMEIDILNHLNWKPNIITTRTFLSHFTALGILEPSDTMRPSRTSRTQTLIKLNKYTYFFAEMCLQEYSFQKYKPCLLAAGIIAAARKILRIAPLWTNNLCQTTMATFKDIEKIIEKILNYFAHLFPKRAETRRIKGCAPYLKPKKTSHTEKVARKRIGITDENSISERLKTLIKGVC